MYKDRLRNWISGIAFHTHSRLDELLTEKEGLLEFATHDSTISTEALVWYAKEFSGDHNIVICDTDHPIHILDRKGVSRKGSFNPSKLPSTIEVISKGVIERARLLKEADFGGNILTGVEADILGSDGRLNVKNEVLKELDIVIASIHYSQWLEHNGGGPTSTFWVDGILHATQNCHVDVIGHPARNYERNVGEGKIEDWEIVFGVMSETSVAFEINLYDYEVSTPPKWNLEEN